MGTIMDQQYEFAGNLLSSFL